MSLHEMLVDEIRDLYHAEKQLIRALPRMAKAVSHEDLREALESHLEETHEQVTRLEEVFSALDERVRAKACPGMAGILEEGAELLKHEKGATLDAAIIAAAQRAEHYEIGAYGTCAAWARLLGLDEVATLLEETLQEEKAADKKLTALAEQEVNKSAAAEGQEDEQEEWSASRSKSRRAPTVRRPAAGARSPRSRASDRKRR